jgi:NADPH:quinone reductase-like Zn-dependent oxidoreductase
LSPLVRQRLRTLVGVSRASDLTVLSELIEGGNVTPIIDRTYPLAEAAEAVRHIAAGHARGKVVITV